MINEASDDELRQAFRRCFATETFQAFENDKDLKGKDLRNFKFKDTQIDTCIVQLRALGLIRESTRQRSVRDTNTYWSLTPYGDYLMSQLRAIRRNPDDQLEKDTDATLEEQHSLADG